MIKILLVDDRPNIREAVEETLRLRMGYEVEIDLRVPVKKSLPFGCELPSAHALERFDLALVDLELFPPESPVEYQEGDLRGGSEVLPYLRKHAPWLPVLAVSRLFADRSDSFLALVGGFGFDGYLPQGIFGSRGILRDQWDAIVKRSQTLRRKALIGDSAYSNRSVPDLEIDPNFGSRLDASIPAWRRTIQDVFFFSDSVVLEEMKSGFSGATLLRAYVRSPDTDASFEGEWAVKISTSPGKLHEEVTAHLRLLRNGFSFTRMVPLLWPGVLVESRTGVIAYKFAIGANTAAQRLDGGMPLADFAVRVAEVLTSLYRSSTSVKGITGEVLRRWMNPVRLAEGVLQLADSKRKAALVALPELSADPITARALTYRKGYVHGDLQCANIMLGPPDVLIDFAFSGPGPLAVDAARLLVDLALRCDVLRSAGTLKWSQLPAELKPIKDVFAFGTDDEALFELAFDAFSVEALTYPSVPPDLKEWVLRGVSGR